MKPVWPLIRSLAVVSSMAALPIITSCNHYFYGSTVHQTALLDTAGELSIQAGVGTADETNFSHLNMAYAFHPKFGAYASYYNANHSGSPSKGNGSYGDFALGYFNKIKYPRLRYELMAGFGAARVYNYFDSANELRNRFRKLFIQGNIGYKSKYFTAVLALRMASVNQYYVSPYTGFAPHDSSLVQDLAQNPLQFAFEPGFYISGGLKNIKLQLGISTCYMAPMGKSNKTYAFQPTFVTAGLRFNINTKR